MLPHYLRSHTYILYHVARLKDGWLGCCAASHMYHSRSPQIAPTESIQLSCDMLNYVRKLPSRSVLRMLDNSALSDERRRTPRCRNAASKYSFLRSQPQNSLFRPSFVGSHVVRLHFKSRCCSSPYTLRGLGFKCNSVEHTQEPGHGHERVSNVAS